MPWHIKGGGGGSLRCWHNPNKVTPVESNPPAFSRAAIVKRGKNQSCL